MKHLKAALVLVSLCLLLIPSLCQAAYDPIASGTTKLILDKGFLAAAKRVGVKVAAKAPAKLKGQTLILPVSGGKSDPTIKKAEIEQEGTIVFQSGNRKVPLRAIELKAKHTPLFAKVGGSQLKVATSKSTKVTRAGFGTVFNAQGLALTQKVATRLDKKLRTKDFFKEGQLIGKLQSQALPERVTILPQGQATLTPDPAILAKFKSLFVSLNPISPAELAPGPVFHFPIVVGSQIAPDASSGTLRLGGAIEALQLGAGQVFQKEFWLDLSGKDTSSEVDLEPTPAFPGKLGRVGTYGIGMAGATVSSEPKSRTISVSGATFTLDAQTAQSFDEAFAGGKAVFGAGEVLGTVGFGAVGQ
jgi:hypothetical protein